jgi:predicted metal-binding membrane protein
MAAAAPSAIEALLRHDRLVTLVALACVCIAAWAYIGLGIGMEMPAAEMPGMAMPGMDMPGMAMDPAMPMPWTGATFALMTAMWAMMMVAMMLPGAAPMLLTYAALQRHRRQAAPHHASLLFVLGYLAVWAGFSILAATLQWQLDALALLSPAMATASTVLAGGALVIAGIYQLTPLKQGCLVRCRAPVEFLTRHRRSGPFGLGLRHGLFCLGCCWALMLLLFVGGVMNLAWIGAIALFVLLEKTIPGGRWLSRAAGAGLIVWGGWTLIAAA